MSLHVAMLVSNACAPDRRVLREAQALAGQGHHVTVIAWDREGHQPAQEILAGIPIERIGVTSGYGLGLRRLGQWPAFARQALRRLRRQDWDAIHCHDLDTLPIGYLHTRRQTASVPLIFDAHESYPDLVSPWLPGWAVGALRRVERFLARRVDAVVTVGDLLADHYRQWARCVVVVRNCQAPAPTLADPAALRHQWGLDTVELLVCYIGGFTRGRVLLPLLEAIKADPALGLVLVGEGPQAPLLLEAAGSADRILYLGRRVPPDQVVNIMRSCDVVYYGLRPDFPNNRFSAPNALYSALEAGRPLLTTDVGEIARVVRDEGCGILLTAPTAEALSAGLARLRVPQVREAMADSARRAAETRYNWAAAEAELLQLYRQLWGNL